MASLPCAFWTWAVEASETRPAQARLEIPSDLWNKKTGEPGSTNSVLGAAFFCGPGAKLIRRIQIFHDHTNVTGQQPNAVHY
ncbi:hypothetical protein F4814DRAFT_449903 [Daldinia grandis]|nr:hypothetical protein F4814DRAFT_449903 [Daldinia grandis]